MLKRLLYAIRFMIWLAIWKVDGPDREFSYYMHRYDRRQEIFRECTHQEERKRS